MSPTLGCLELNLQVRELRRPVAAFHRFHNQWRDTQRQGRSRRRILASTPGEAGSCDLSTRWGTQDPRQTVIDRIAVRFPQQLARRAHGG